MESFALVNGHVLDPATGYDARGGVLVSDGVIAAVGAEVNRKRLTKAHKIIDVGGRFIAPGLIDAQVFVGEPGEEHRETFESTARAAFAGGVTTIGTQPSTLTPIDSAAMVKLVRDRAQEAGIKLAPMAAMTIALEGKQMSNFGMLRDAGACALTDTPNAVGNARLMRQAMLYAKTFDALLVQHVEDDSLIGGGVMHEGQVASNLGLAGIPREAETVILVRDLMLNEGIGGRYHAAALSSGTSIPHLRRAKENQSKVSAGVQIAHLLLTDADVGRYYTFRKLSPPLREASDCQLLREAVADGTIDIIVSGHNPQPPDTKRQPFVDAAAGAVGLETLLPAILLLHQRSGIPLLRLIDCVTRAPAELLNLAGGTLRVGASADMVVFDNSTAWTLQRKELLSRCVNTCFDKQQFVGVVHQTYLSGKKVYQRSA